MSDAFTHSWSLVKEEPCSNCGGIDPDGVYECEGCQQGFCQNCMGDGGLYGAAHDRYFDTRLPEIDMTRSKLANEYMSFQGDIESGANNMCRNCFEEYENSEPGAIKDAIGDARMERDDEIEAERNTVWPPVRSDKQMEDLRIQQQRNEAEMDLSEKLFGDRKFQLKNASSDEPFESAWSVVKGAKKERSCDACGKDVPMGQGAHLERDHMNKPGEHGWYCDKCAEKGEMY